MKGCKNRRERRERETREQRAGEGGQGERREKKTWEKRKSKRRSQRVENKCQGYKSLSRETRNLFFSSSSSLLSPHLSFKASLRVTMERAFARGERDAERGRREREREREREKGHFLLLRQPRRPEKHPRPSFFPFHFILTQRKLKERAKNKGGGWYIFVKRACVSFVSVSFRSITRSEEGEKKSSSPLQPSRPLLCFLFTSLHSLLLFKPRPPSPPPRPRSSAPGRTRCARRPRSRS